ncbi:DASH complex subunit ask1 [Massospora cicadina]|nr:DASH complex subunit ask1 [Massospora cicadina]
MGYSQQFHQAMVEQNITATLQEIDETFAACHEAVTHNILPVVDSFITTSRSILASMQGWQSFFKHLNTESHYEEQGSNGSTELLSTEFLAPTPSMAQRAQDQRRLLDERLANPTAVEGGQAAWGQAPFVELSPSSEFEMDSTERRDTLVLPFGDQILESPQLSWESPVASVSSDLPRPEHCRENMSISPSLSISPAVLTFPPVVGFNQMDQHSDQIATTESSPFISHDLLRPEARNGSSVENSVSPSNLTNLHQLSEGSSDEELPPQLEHVTLNDVASRLPNEMLSTDLAKVCRILSQNPSGLTQPQLLELATDITTTRLQEILDVFLRFQLAFTHDGLITLAYR